MSSLDHLIKKLAGASPSVAVKSEEEPVESGSGKTDPVYVEKLASAVDFIVDSIGSEETTESVTETVEPEEAIETEVEKVSEISSRIRQSLQSRLKEKTAKKSEVSEEDKQIIDNVLSRLKSMTPSEGGSADETVEDEINQIYNTEETDVSNEADGEAAEKAASADLSLADVLNAALGTDEQETDSSQVVDDEAVKTANVQGSTGLTARKDATSILKEKLMAKISGEEAQS